jgi:hypothetical protein
LIDKEACVNGTSEMNRAQKNQFLRNQTSFKTPLDFAMNCQSQELISELILNEAKQKHQLIQERTEASSGLISPIQYQGDTPSTSITAKNVIRLLQYFYNAFPK